MRLSVITHYRGASENLDYRIRAHMTGKGSEVTKHWVRLGVPFTVAKTWVTPRPFQMEIALKKRSARSQCPLCRGRRKRRP